MSTSLKLCSEYVCDARYMPTLQDNIVIVHESLGLTKINHQLLHEP